MKKTLIFPLSGLIILGVCAFFFLDPSQEKEKVELSLPEVLFETSGFYDQEILNDKELDDFFIVNFLLLGASPVLLSTHCLWSFMRMV